MKDINSEDSNLINIELLDGEKITLPKRNQFNLQCDHNSFLVDIILSDEEEEENKGQNNPEFTDNSLSKQMNMNACIKDLYWIERTRRKKSKSLIYCQDEQNNYALSFYPDNVRMKIIRSKNRTTLLKDNSKPTQLKYKYRYKQFLDRNSKKVWLLKKIYSLDHKTINNNNNVSYVNSRNKKKTNYASNRTKLRKSDKSMEFRRVHKGNLEIEYSGIVFNFQPPLMKIEKMQTNTFKLQACNELHNLTIKSGKNPLTNGSVLAKIEHEVVLFKFDLVDIEFVRTWFKVTRATQSTNQSTYIKYWSESSLRLMHCSIPLSTYKYVDPMVNIRRRNNYNIRRNKYPEWMREMRQKRLKEKTVMNEKCEAEKNEKKEKVHELLETNRKGCQFQLNTMDGVLIRVKSGILDGVIKENVGLYEKTINSYLRQQLKYDGNNHTNSKPEDLELQDQDLTTNFL